MDNFFSKVDKANIDASYHSPYKFLSAENTTANVPKRMGDFVTTLWLETAGLTVFMSSVILVPIFFKVLG
jgi:hypothetical protein